MAQSVQHKSWLKLLVVFSCKVRHSFFWWNWMAYFATIAVCLHIFALHESVGEIGPWSPYNYLCLLDKSNDVIQEWQLTLPSILKYFSVWWNMIETSFCWNKRIGRPEGVDHHLLCFRLQTVHRSKVELPHPIYAYVFCIAVWNKHNGFHWQIWSK